jgi:hypothetical protein
MSSRRSGGGDSEVLVIPIDDDGFLILNDLNGL